MAVWHVDMLRVWKVAAGAMKAVIGENGVGRGLLCRLGLQRAVHATAWYAVFIVL